jgi:penicillin-insensitive murein endopeptidase
MAGRGQAVELRAPAPRQKRPADDWEHLDQNPEWGEGGAGYYTYGKMPPGMAGTKADFQYGKPEAMQFIIDVVNRVQVSPKYTPFGIGNISLAGGRGSGDHKGHISGLEIDVRPARNDGRQGPDDGLTYRHAAYDRAATRRLIKAFQDTGRAEFVLFNDPELIAEFKGFVRRDSKVHDNHLHVKVRPRQD